MNRSALLEAEVPPAVVTVTWTAPADPAGEVTVNDVALTNPTETPAVAPNATVEAAVNPDPVTVTVVPPANGPAAGAIPVTAGTEL